MHKGIERCQREKVNCIKNNGANLNFHVFKVDCGHRSRCSFLVCQTRELVEGVIHLNDAPNAYFDSNTLLSIQYHIFRHVAAKPLSCILWSNKLNKTEVAGGKGHKRTKLEFSKLYIVKKSKATELSTSNYKLSQIIVCMKLLVKKH